MTDPKACYPRVAGSTLSRWRTRGGGLDVIIPKLGRMERADTKNLPTKFLAPVESDTRMQTHAHLYIYVHLYIHTHGTYTIIPDLTQGGNIEVLLV